MLSATVAIPMMVTASWMAKPKAGPSRLASIAIALFDRPLGSDGQTEGVPRFDRLYVAGIFWWVFDETGMWMANSIKKEVTHIYSAYITIDSQQYPGHC